jgi:DNA-binding CsgD family transcriptional regulator
LKDTARTVAPAEQWRRQLARSLFDPKAVPLSMVFTCSPSSPLTAKGHVVPEAAGQVFEEIFLNQLFAQVQRAGHGVDQARAVGSSAYAPLEGHSGYVGHLAERVQKQILEPFGAKGLLVAYLLDARSEVIGWLGAGTRKPSLEALEELGPRLTATAEAASKTLQAALDLACACGAALPSAAHARLMKLTRREAEIARLVASGLSDLNIAQHLSLSENTVGSHLRRIYAKLGCHSRVEIAALLSAHRELLDRGNKG